MTTVESFLEHHGVKGMKWGFRKGFGTGIKPLTSFGKVAAKGAFKGGKGAAKFSWNHPKTAAAIAVGSAFAVHFAKKRAEQKVTEIKNSENAKSGKAKVDKMLHNSAINVTVGFK